MYLFTKLVNAINNPIKSLFFEYGITCYDSNMHNKNHKKGVIGVQNQLPISFGEVLACNKV